MDHVSREEFQSTIEKVGESIRSHIDEKFEDHSKLESLRHETITKTLGKHDATLYGSDKNGANPGLHIKVDRLNLWVKAVSSMVAATWGTMAAYLNLK